MPDAAVAPAVEQVVARPDARLGRLLIATRGDEVRGWLLLPADADPVTAHRVL